MANDDISKMQKHSFVKEFIGEDTNTMSRNKHEHNYYHHHQSNQKKNNYIENNKEPGGGGYQFSKSFHDLSFANNLYEPQVFHTNLEQNRSGHISVDNNLDFILPPKDYLGYRANERSDGYKTLGAPGSERRRMDGSKSFQQNYATTNKKSDAMHKKRSQSFLVHSGGNNMSSDEKYGNMSSHNLPTEIEVQHIKPRQKQNGVRRSRKLYSEDPSQKYAEDFHKNKRHTYHFPDLNTPEQFNHCEDLTFTKHLSRENIFNANKSSNENLLVDNGQFVDNQFNYGLTNSMQEKMKSSRTDRKKDYTKSSYLEEIRNSHQRSSSSPPSADAYGKILGNAKTDISQHQQALRNKKNHRTGFHPNIENQVHYSTIDHLKSDYLKCNKNDQNQASKSNVCNENYVNNNIIHMNENENFVRSPNDVGNECNFLHIEREIPMQSASLEAQKFKTIIFLSGQ